MKHLLSYGLLAFIGSLIPLGVIFALETTSVDIIKLQSGRQILFVGRYTFPPPLYYPHNSQKGLVTEIFDAVAKRAGIKKVRYVDFNTVSELRTAFEQGKIDVISNVWDTPFNRSRYLLTTPFHMGGGVGFLYLKGQGPYQTADNLRGQTIGTLENRFFKNYCFTNIAAPEKSIKTYHNFNELVAALKRSDVDVVITYITFARYEQKIDSRYQATLIEPMRNVYAVHKQDFGLQKLLDQAINSLSADETLYEISQKYLKTGMLDSISGNMQEL